MSKKLVPLLAILLAATPVRAAELVQTLEKRGDFYYDASGEPCYVRHAAFPADLTRRPMSHREKFELLGIQLPERAASLKPRWVMPKPAKVEWRPSLMKNKVVVKFVEGARVRLRDQALASQQADLAAFQEVLTQFPEAKLVRLFTTEERILDENKESGERVSGQQLADLNNYYLLEFPEPSDRAVDLVNRLLALPVVENAYLQAVGEPAVCGDVAPTTPDWEANQNYLNPAPDGVDAEYAWTYHAGGNGAGTSFWVMDLEWQWCYTHEDLPISSSDVVNGSTGNSVDYMNHGTAVLGEFGSCRNGYGMSGISHDVRVKMADFDSEPSWAANITTADSYLLAGEVMLLEIHIGGPDSGEDCVCNCDQFEMVPVEWDAASFDAISTATANGVIVVEAGGNGSMNLDNAIYGGAFNRSLRDSRAIIVGAGTNNGHAPECWTNYGSRVDVHGYGDGVYSTGYGGLWGQADCPQDYTASFSGTSSASPIITGVCAVMQGIANQKYNYDLTPLQMRNRILVGATPQAASAKNIGPMPDLFDAINGIEPNLAEYTPSGWAYPVVPRPTNDSNAGYAPLIPGALPGYVAGTYWNWATMNYSTYSPTLNITHTELYRDGVGLYACQYGSLDPSAWQWCGNVGSPDVVKGGRHTIRTVADYLGVEDESSETDNDYARQFIWSGLTLTRGGEGSVQTGDPPATSTGYGPYYNAQGIQGSTGSDWIYAFAVMPCNMTDDHDIRLNTEVPGNVPQQGWGAAVASSTGPAGEIEFVVVDCYEQPTGVYYASLLNFTGSGAGDRVVEWDSDNGIVSNPGTTGPFIMDSDNIIELHQVVLTEGVGEYRIQVHVTSGTADLGISVFDTEGGFFGKTNTLPGGYADNAGPGGDEFAIVTPGVSGVYGIAVWKKNADSRTQYVAYDILVSQDPNLTDISPAGWYGPVVPRNTTDATTSDAPLPVTLSGNTTTTSYNFLTHNEGANSALAPWRTHLFVDDVHYWSGFAVDLASGGTLFWLNSAQGLDPYSLVRGGRHYIRVDSDALGQVTEFSEADNTYVDWFVWTPLELADQTPVVRAAPPLGYPTGAVWPAVDGFRATPTPSGSPYWMAVGLLPLSAPDDFDIVMYDASTGSKDGFGSFYAVSNYGGSVSDFSIVNYNVASRVARDYGAFRFSGTGDYVIQRADGYYLGDVAASRMFGPFTIDASDVLNFHEIHIASAMGGIPLYIYLFNDTGNANLGIAVYSGTAQYHTKASYLANANSNGAGADEVISTVTLPGNAYYGIAVYKNDSVDYGRAGTYRILVSSLPVGVEGGEIKPTAFALPGAHPNPFLSSTEIRYDVPASGRRVSLVLYNVNGQRVRTLVEEVVPAGRHAARWDGTDDEGRRLPAGVYFARLESERVRLNRKVTLLR
jgi:hypothetical protein